MSRAAARSVTIKVYRHHPSTATRPYLAAYHVPAYPRATVLSALLYIYEHLDPTLAFRYGCRFQKCGQCAVEINGRPRLACLTYLKPDTTVRPLPKFPLLQDLVIERRGLWEKLLAYELYLPGGVDLAGTIAPDAPSLREPPEHARLMACRECLCCQAACPAWEGPEAPFGGPCLFVRLAQLLWDPRNDRDRRSQARALGIERCRSCGKCYCPNGIHIWRDAIMPLLGS